MDSCGFLFEKNPQPMWIYDLETLRFLEVNTAAVLKYGYSREEFLEMTLKDIRPKSDVEALLKDIDSDKDLYNPGSRWRHVTKRGELIYVKISSFKIYYKSKDAKFVMVTDITEEVMLEHKIRESEERFRGIFENNHSVFLIIEPYSGRVLDVNIAAENFYGWSREKMKSMHIWEINTLNKEQISVEMESAVLQKRGFYNFKHRRADGSICDVEVYSGTMNYDNLPVLFSIVFDVTEKHKLQSELFKLSHAVMNSSTGVMITNTNGIIEQVNPSVCTSTGYTQDELVGQSVSILKSGVHSSDLYVKLWKTLLSGKNWSGEFCNKKKNGELYWDRSIISPVYDHTGTIVSFVAIKEDITKEKRLIDNLVEAKRKAEEGERIKSSFISSVTHEFKTPLNAIIGFSDFIIEESNQQNIRNFAATISDSGIYLKNLVDNIIDLGIVTETQIEVRPEPVDVSKIIDKIAIDAEREIRLLKKGEIAIIKNVPESIKENIYMLDNKLVTHALQILVRNSIKFTERGFVEIGVCSDNLESQSEGSVIFYVKDSGIGIGGEFMKHIFDPFRQEDESYQKKHGGTGIGLSICKQIADLIGAKLWVESQKERDSVFYLQIKGGEIVKDKEMTQKILVAEDDDTSFTLLNTLLKKYSIPVIRALNGKSAFEIVSTDNSISLVLMDIQMPVLDGFESTKLIKNFKPNLPVVAQTAYSIIGDREKALAAGCDDYISKPINKNLLYSIVDRFLNQ